VKIAVLRFGTTGRERKAFGKGKKLVATEETPLRGELVDTSVGIPSAAAAKVVSRWTGMFASESARKLVPNGTQVLPCRAGKMSGY